MTAFIKSFKINSPITLLLLSMLTSLLLMLNFFWVCDDAFISFRFAKNFALGEGLRYNLANEVPVEGYSNLLWVLLASFFEMLSIPSFKVIPYLSILCMLILIVKVYQTGLQYFNLSQGWSAASACSLALFPPIIIWGTSGLEPAPFALLIFLVFEQLFLKKDPSTITLYCYGLMLCMIRVEGGLWAITLAALAFLFFTDKRKESIKFFAFILVLIGIYTAFRYFYYQEFVPNTASTKVAFSSMRLVRGFNYTAVFALTFITPILAIFALLARPTRLVLTCTLIFLGFYLYSILSGGDYMTMGRFLIPSIAFQTILLGVLFSKISTFNKLLAYCLYGLCTGIAFMPLYEKHIVPQHIRANFHFRLNTSKFLDEMQQYRFMQENALRWRKKGELLKSISEPNDSLIEGTIGAVGYFSDLYIHDRLGLVSKLDRRFMRTQIRSAGHDMKAPLDFFMSSDPTYLYANLERNIDSRRILELKKFYPYAPFIESSDYKSKYKPDTKYTFLYFKKVSSETEYKERWALLDGS